MEDVTRDPDDPDAWMWWRDDEDAPRDATKKARQMLFLIRDSSLITLFSTTSSSDEFACSSTRRISVVNFAITLRCAVKSVYV